MTCIDVILHYFCPFVLQLMMSSVPLPPQTSCTVSEGTDTEGYSNVNLQLSPTVESPDTQRIEEDNTDKGERGKQREIER